MDAEDIREALTNVAPIRENQLLIRARRVPNIRDINLTRTAFVRFLELLDGDVTVAQIRDALEND